MRYIAGCATNVAGASQPSRRPAWKIQRSTQPYPDCSIKWMIPPVSNPAQQRSFSLEHYPWAGLDFIFNDRGVPFFLEANRCSHMLQEYVEVYGNEEPFRHVAK